MGDWAKKHLQEFAQQQAAARGLEERAALEKSLTETEIPKAWELLKQTLIEEITTVSRVYPRRFSIEVLSHGTIKLVGHHDENIEVFISLKQSRSNGEDIMLIEFVRQITTRYTHE